MLFSVILSISYAFHRENSTAKSPDVQLRDAALVFRKIFCQANQCRYHKVRQLILFYMEQQMYLQN